MSQSNDILKRKSDHIDLVLQIAERKDNSVNPFDQIRLTHNALPECHLEGMSLATEFLGKQLKLPFLISSMTGGPLRAERINAHLAEAAQELGIALGVGSQRVALLDRGACGLTSEVRTIAPDIPIYANLGAAQLRDDFSTSEVQRAVDMIEADALIIHLNTLQEAIQDSGDIDWTGIELAIEHICRNVPVPVIVKEVGMGLSAPVAVRLVQAGVSAIDVAGSGGTNFVTVEGSRSTDSEKASLAEMFRDWGLSTPDALRQVRKKLPLVPLIASGGIRHGIDAAKAIRLGADLVAQAGPVLKTACESSRAVVEHFRLMEKALRLALACSHPLLDQTEVD